MQDDGIDNVLLVWGGGDGVAELLGNMLDNGISVIGPAKSASIAMTLAAQSAPTLAVIARPPNGRRDATQLADDLYKIWGVCTWVMPSALADDGAEPAAWAAPEAKIERVRRAMGNATPLQ
jgi:hypothetical protein